MKTWLLNNCRNLDHKAIYGRPDAFYDLWDKDREKLSAERMALGDRAMVLSYGEDTDEIVIHEHILLGKTHEQTREGPTWVMCGRWVRGMVLARVEAQRHPVFRYFFNTRGDLLQMSANEYQA